MLVTRGRKITLEQKKTVKKKEGKKDKDEREIMVVEKGKEVVVNEKVMCDPVTILTRMSPSHLKKVLDSLTTQHVSVLEELGFGKYHNNFDFISTPGALGMWIIKNYDPEEHTIKMVDEIGKMSREEELEQFKSKTVQIKDDKIKIALDENPEDSDLKMILGKRLAFFKELYHRDVDNAMVVLDKGNDVPEEAGGCETLEEADFPLIGLEDIESLKDQVMLRAFLMSLTGLASRWLRNKPSGSITTLEDLKTKFLSKYCPPARTTKKMKEINNFQQEPDENLYQAWERFKELLMKGAIPSKTAADAKVAIQKMIEYSQKWHNETSRTRGTETSVRLAAIQAQLNNLGREIKKVNEKVYAAQVGCDQCKGPHYTKIVYSRKKGKPLKNLTTLNLNRTLMYKTKQTTILFSSHLNGYYCKEKKGSYGPEFSKAYSKASHINISIPKKEKDPGSFTLSCFINNVCFDNALADLAANVSVMRLSTYLNLGLGELAHTKLTVELTDRTVKYPKGIAENMLVGLRERMELDLEARLMGETLVLNRSLDPFFKDYIELNNLNVPLELRRDQVYDVMPTIEEGKVVEEFRARNYARMVRKVFGYPSNYDHDKKIHIDCAYNLKLSCIIGFEFLHANFFPIFYVNVMSKKIYNSIRKDKLEYKGNNAVGALMNIPIFGGTFSILIDFVVLEDMDAYRDEGMGDVKFGELLLREVRINAK
nr:hypothetical protein [Tanacetum cinerariifolium]